MKNIEICQNCEGDGQVINPFGFPEQCFSCDGNGIK